MPSLASIAMTLLQPSELIALLRVKFGQHKYVIKPSDLPLSQLAKDLGDREYCYAALNKVSRSFAMVIQELPEELMDAVCVFYLVLRGLDSVEDDMDYPIEKRVPEVRRFYQHLEDPHFKLPGVGDTADYRMLMADFDKVTRSYLALDSKYRKVVSTITKLMGEGMAEFAEKGSVKTVKELDLYCHYVAGLVGYGLSSLFAESGLEDKGFAKWHNLSNQMGLFLQRTNIIRDYLEDLEGGRTWYPEEVWGRYASSLSDFRLEPSSPSSLACLNELVAQSLELVPASLDYLSRLNNPAIFRFCAIPQVMAIATLAEVYNNPNVFKKEVKIRKGVACKIVLQCNNFEDVLRWFDIFARSMRKRVPAKDPSSDRIKAQLDSILERTAPCRPSALSTSLTPALLLAVMLFLDATRVSPLVDLSTPQFSGLAFMGLVVVIIAIALFVFNNLPTPYVPRSYKLSFQSDERASEKPNVPESSHTALCSMNPSKSTNNLLFFA